jgi:small subunit ribosomal protein S21
MTTVISRSGESPESLLKRFRKEVTNSGVLSDARKKRWYVSRSEQRRIEKRKAIRRVRRKQARRERRERTSGF